MSDNQIAVGLVAPLVQPLTPEQREELWEKLDSLNLDINYEGTLIFSYEKKVESYNFELHIGNPANPDDFAELCKCEGLEIQAHNSQSYFMHWYDGSDNPMSMLTLGEFNV